MTATIGPEAAKAAKQNLDRLADFVMSATRFTKHRALLVEIRR
jgi:hypothetical protein